MGPVTLLAALLDAFILFTIVHFGREQFKRFPALHKYFVGLVLLGVIAAFGIIYFFMTELYTANIYGAVVDGETPAFVRAGLQGGIFTGWGLALMMGLLFIAMLLSRGDLRGQSLYIALFMLLGNVGAFLFDITAAPRMPNLVNYLVLLSLTTNATYAAMVYRKSRSLGINPWRRW
jgi:glucan phosphoethanolaminetransferase (alkaline phosphatase superfamily)